MPKSRRIIFFGILLLLIVAVVAGMEWTASSDQPLVPVPKKADAKPLLVNQQPLEMAQRFTKYVGSREEDEFAQEAIRLADHELDLAFNTALRQAQQNPTAETPQARELRKHVRDLQDEIKSDQAEIKKLQSAGADDDDIELKQAELGLHQEELDDAKSDLDRTGEDAESRVQKMLAAHEAEQHNPQQAAVNANRTVQFKVPDTLLEQLALRQRLGKRLIYLGRAQQLSIEYGQKLAQKHEELEQQLIQAAPADKSAGHAQAVAALHKQAGARQTLAEYDKRIEDQKQLAQVYGNWAALIGTQRQALTHGVLTGVLEILLIILLLFGVDFLIDRFLLRQTADRRRRSAMRLVVRFVLQVVGVVAAMFVVFGRPSQLSTVLGLAGAGLTVALKDFIVGFFGWFVLMGKNGIRVGDWVEINGIGGEVVEIGLLRTVLLETGNWADSGHPTGRKVTFVNSYAIEGHYFNFSTSGQWLWDTLEILVPPGQEPYPISESILKLVVQETEANAREAEQEWQRATKEYGVQSFSATPSINLRPALSGVNVIVRYITRANQRYEQRTRLYEGVVSLLHQGATVKANG